MQKTMKTIAIAAIVVLGALQLLPYGRNHSNPPVVKEPSWAQSSTRLLTARACFDCHSNQTRWPWYSNLAPISWAVQRDVELGRRALNFSEWQRNYEEAGESVEAVLESQMPPKSYLILHSAARLSSSEKGALAQGLAGTIASPGREGS